ISQSQVDPKADFLTMRPGLDSVGNMQLTYGNGGQKQNVNPNGPPPGPEIGPGGDASPNACPRGSCVADPVIEEVGALPSGTSAPNTVLTEHAVHHLGLQSALSGWLIQTTHPLSAAQVTEGRQTAAAAGLSIETKNDAPSSDEVIDWATVFGILLALGILAMTVGLIRSETASDLRTLSAAGASSSTRRSLTAATAGALALLGAVLGTAGAYVGSIAYLSSNKLDGLSSLGNTPLKNLGIIVVAMPLLAAAAGWLMAGRQPSVLSHQPIE
ncbi:MAG TPA: hypothetical protein VMF60_03250, partial [Acidimicrobiales bacterium]|nr:hypothetical protein [Acidimicrobiales bacterium]